MAGTGHRGAVATSRERGGRRRRVTHRALPLGVLAAAAFAAGIALGAGHEPPGRQVAIRFAEDWARGDYPAMYALLAPASRRHVSLAEFTAAYRDARTTATATAVRPESPRSVSEGLVVLPVRVRTRLWGTLRAPLRVPVVETDLGVRVRWRPALVFPGLRPGERLSRHTTLPARGDILARDGTPLAEGPDRTSPLDVASQIAGVLQPVPEEERAAYRARGYPEDAKVGGTGLERVFQDRLAGTPGGVLRAGSRVLAGVAPKPGKDVRTTIDPEVERAAIEALGGRLGGVVAMRPHDGQVLALAGIAFSATQPPGSTFKIVTLTAALESGVAKPETTYPVQTSATLSGVELRNANGESCGGTLAEAFAESCNSVFAPLGAQLGARRLVDTARRYGFDHDPWIPGAATPTIPPADEIGDDLAVGSTAIGQGRVAATALEMTEIAATVANHGKRPRPVLELGRPPSATRVTSPKVARTVARLMQGVVEHGTGTAAQIAGVDVAGKTGTAELETTVHPEGDPDTAGTPTSPAEDDTSDTDAWFVCFAPAGHPKVTVGVMLVRAGAGGATAAPVARTVLETALER